MTAQLAPTPVFKGWDSNGQPLFGGQLATFISGTDTPQATWVDATQTTQNQNPIILDARGEADVWLDPTLIYKFALSDALGNLIWTADQIVGGYIPVTQFASYITQAYIGQTLFPQTTGEIAANVTPVNYQYQAGNVLRYGADPTGIADSTAPINAALSSNTGVYVPGGTYVCSNSLNMTSGQTFYGDGPTSVLQYSNGALSNIVMQSLTNSTVRDLKVNITGSNGSLKFGAVYLVLCTACHVERMEIAGHNWAGVWLDQSNKCFIRDNYIHDAPFIANTTNNGADIALWSNSTTAASNYNVISGNQCFGINTAFGVNLIDPDAATATTGYPLRNVVAFNRIGAHTTYGCLLYLPGLATTAADTFNSFIGNWVENITGLSQTGFGLPNTSSGAGIYCVGKGIGGLVVMGNSVSNCCINTLLRNLAPAGVGINGVQTGVTRPIIANNSVNGMTQGDGVLVTSSPGGALVTGNSINIPSSNAGSGPGGASLLGDGVRVEASSDVEVGPNNVLVFGAGVGCFVYANGINSQRVSLSGGTYTTSGIAPALQVTQNGGFNVTQFSATGSKFTVSNATPDAVSLTSVIVGFLSNCLGAANTARGLFVNTCSSIRISGGEYTTGGSVSVATASTCTNGFMTRDTIIGGNASLINNAGTGFRIEWFGTVVPAAGTWAVGDTVYNTTPAAAGVFLWVCTTAGTGGGTAVFKTVSNT